LIAKTRGDNNRGHPQCTHDLDHYNLPVVAGDCLLALPITLRRSAERPADLKSRLHRSRGKVCLVLLLSMRVSLNIF
jgi:hypothetical protein